MRGGLLLLGWNLKRDRGTLLWLAGGLVGFEMLVVWMARVLDERGGYAAMGDFLASMSDFASRAAGFDVALLLNFSGALGLGYFHPAVMAALIAAITVVGRGPVAEIDARTSELLIARPFQRTALVSASLLELLVIAVGLPLAMLAGTTAGLALVGRLGQAAFGPYVRLAANDALLIAALGAVFILIASVSSRIRSYMQAVVSLAIVSYLLDYLARIWAPIRPLGPLSLFHYLEPARVLAGQPVLHNLLALAAIAAAAAALALLAIERRDI